MQEAESAEPSNAFLGLLTAGLAAVTLATVFASLAGLAMLASPGGEDSFGYLAMAGLLVVGPLAPVGAGLVGWWLAMEGRRNLAVRLMIGLPLGWIGLIMIVQILFW